MYLHVFMVNRNVLFVALPALLLLCASLFLAGCNSGESVDFSDVDTRGERALRGSHGHLARAVRLVGHLEDYDHAQASAQVMSHLGQWIEGQPPLDDWSADPMLQQLPQRYQRLVPRQALKRMQFITHDFFALREAIWARNIARWQAAQLASRRNSLREQLQSPKISETPDEAAHLEQQLMPLWLRSLRDAHGEEAAEQVLLAADLFDWTVRNIQLDETNWEVSMESVEQIVNETKEQRTANGRPIEAPAGARHHAWQALLLGRGDAPTRARVFCLLARQRGIDVVMLGLKRKRKNAEPRTWLAAALVAGNLFLFDPALGLPVPGPGGKGIATWKQLQEDPQLLRQLDLPDSPYPFAADDLQRVVALIDATPPYCSQRMALVERNLKDDEKLVLTVEPGLLRRQLREIGIEDSEIWTVPYRVFEFERLTQQHLPTRQAALNELKIFGGPFPLLSGRLLHFRGQLDSDGEHPGAKAYYLECRKPDKQIEAIEDSPELRARVSQMRAFRDRPEAKERFIEEIQAVAMSVKDHSTYWLGMVAFENGNYGVAINYLRDRTLNANPDGPWTPGARYNLARVFERTGHASDAVTLYEASAGPQRHGNLLRAARLKAGP